VTKLVLVGATPKFVQGPDWKQALPLSLLQQFAADLMADYDASLTRFLSLQIGDEPGARGLIEHLRMELFRYGEPDAAAMHSGLQLLRDTDLRTKLPSVQQPVLLIHGPRDRLAPLAAAEFMTTQLPHARLTSFAHAGHVPFLSHTQEFAAAVEGFIHE
jgi:pimeloyl-[acyl-carrier protein] methyl ester esterase